LIRPATKPILLIVPPLGAALVVLASRSDGLYRLLVREDALLEWTQVLAYVFVAATAAVAVGAVDLRLDGDDARLTVIDEGVGIPPDDVPRIFERFYRGSNVAGAIEGTGLGLTGSRHIVEQHGGQLLVESTQGTGSVFTLLLPARAPLVAADAPPRDVQVVGAGAP